MSLTNSTSAAPHAAHHHDADSTDVLGFWLYIMTDCILFACLFATYFVLTGPHAVGPRLKSFIDLPYVLIETFLLLASNFTYCLAMFAVNKKKVNMSVLWLALTFVLGAGFVIMEVTEFAHLAHEGFTWHTSGAASAFFTLVGTHGFHVSMGLLWILIMMIQLPKLKLNDVTTKRMVYLGLFWNFLDIVWIFLFTFVYLMGAL